jgi:3-oxoadipate enol-lactonase
MSTISIGSTSLHVLDQGRGAPLLLVHGFPLDHTMWRGQVSELSQTHRVLAPDLRGFGQSSPLAAEEAVVTMARFADDMAALLTALQVTEPVTFCGLSMGGYIAWQFAARHPSRLGRLILCDTKAAADTPEAAENRHKLANKVLAEGAQVAADAMLPKLFSQRAGESGAPCVEETRQTILRTPPPTIAAALRGMAAREDFTSKLGNIQVPTLLVCGAEDAITPPAEMRTIVAAIPGAEYAEIPAAGHMSPLENPPAVNRAIRNFLDSSTSHR